MPPNLILIIKGPYSVGVLVLLTSSAAEVLCVLPGAETGTSRR